MTNCYVHIGADCWAVSKKDVRKLHTTEIRMLRWAKGMTRLASPVIDLFCDMLFLDLVLCYPNWPLNILILVWVYVCIGEGKPLFLETICRDLLHQNRWDCFQVIYY